MEGCCGTHDAVKNNRFDVFMLENGIVFPATFVQNRRKATPKHLVFLYKKSIKNNKNIDPMKMTWHGRGLSVPEATHLAQWPLIT